MCEFCEKWDFEIVNCMEKCDFEPMNFVKNENLNLSILWKMRIWTCEFCEKWEFEGENFVKSSPDGAFGSVLFSIFPNFFAIEILPIKCRLCTQNFITLRSNRYSCRWADIPTDRQTQSAIYYIDEHVNFVQNVTFKIWFLKCEFRQKIIFWKCEFLG